MAVKLVAHRGESAYAPENTIESFNFAWEHGVKTVEGDFHMTRDGEIVCMHDANTRRTTGVDKLISEQTLAELKSLDAGSWFSTEWKGCQIPTLREVLDTLPSDGEIYIELKGGVKLLQAIRKIFASGSWSSEQLTFLSGQPEVKSFFPEHKVYWCTANYGDDRLSPDELVAKVKELGVDGVSDWLGSGITRKYVDKMHSAGYSYHVWTIDLPWDAQNMINIGIDSITSNRASMLIKELEQI